MNSTVSTELHSTWVSHCLSTATDVLTRDEWSTGTALELCVRCLIANRETERCWLGRVFDEEDKNIKFNFVFTFRVNIWTGRRYNDLPQPVCLIDWSAAVARCSNFPKMFHDANIYYSKRTKPTAVHGRQHRSYERSPSTITVSIMAAVTSKWTIDCHWIYGICSTISHLWKRYERGPMCNFGYSSLCPFVLALYSICWCCDPYSDTKNVMVRTLCAEKNESFFIYHRHHHPFSLNWSLHGCACDCIEWEIRNSLFFCVQRRDWVMSLPMLSLPLFSSSLNEIVF